MSQLKLYTVLLAIVVWAMACSKDEDCTDPNIDDNRTCTLSPVDSSFLRYGNQTKIVASKLFSYAVSTEDECAFSPLGRWANLFGTTYYRYAERGAGSHAVNLSGLQKESAEAAASILTPFQLNQMVAIAPAQLERENQARMNRDGIARELYQWKLGTPGNENLILSLSTTNGSLLKDMLNQRTSVFANIIKALTADQKRRLCLSRNADHSSVDNTVLASSKNMLASEEERKMLNLLLSTFLTWATGTVEMNEAVNDGRPADYFGFSNISIEGRDGDDINSGLRNEASDLVYNTLKNMQRNDLTEYINTQPSFIEAYLSSRVRLANMLLEYQSPTVLIDLTTLSNLCINTELLESQLAIRQAKALGSIMESLDANQLQTFQNFKDGN